MNSKSLLYAQSPSAGQSNWMPWELSVVDGHTGKCFIMLVTKDAQQVTPRREYLAIYPYVKLGIDGKMKIVRDSAGGDFVTDYVGFVKN